MSESPVETHPSPELLRRFGNGELPSPEADIIEEHVQNCAVCCQQLREMPRDPLEDRLQTAVGAEDTRVPPAPGPDHAPIQEVIEAMKTVPFPGLGPLPPGRQPGDKEERYDYLAPPRAPGELGWLGPYRVICVLGNGGMGIVFQAEEPRLKRSVALKVMKPTLAASSSACARFLREAQATAAIEHDHIVAIYQVGEDRGLPFLAMPLLRGETLADRLERQNKLTMEEVLSIGREIASGLAGAHARNLIHRDIKPANIWLETLTGRTAPGGSGFRVKILDFGLARPVKDETHLTSEFAVLGTPAYMAPEQVEGQPVDVRCDLFSLGCVLYQLCTGQPPFKAGNAATTLAAVLMARPRPPHELNAAVPQELSDLVMQLLEKDPARRPASAEDVFHALQLLERKLARQKEAEAASSPPRRRRWPWAAGAAVLLVGAALAAAMIIIPTPKGKLVIESDDPSAEVVVKQNGAVIRQKTPERTLELKVGDYEIELVDARSGLKLSAPRFTIDPGQPTQIRIFRETPPAPPSAPLSPSSSQGIVFKPWELTPQTFPAGEHPEGLPKEMVAILGTHRGWHPGQGGCQLAYSPDGNRVASVTYPSVIVWDANTLRSEFTIPFQNEKGYDVAFSPKGKLLACSSDRIRFWDLSGAKPIEKPSLGLTSPAKRLRYSPNGNLLACTCVDRKVRLWDMAKMPSEVPGLPEHEVDENCRVSFSGDNNTLAFADGKGTVYVWDLSVSPPRQETVTHKGQKLSRVAMAPNGKMLAACVRSGPVWLLDLTAPNRELQGPITDNSWQDLTFSPNGKMLAVGIRGHWAELIELVGALPKQKTLIPGCHYIESLSFSPDGNTLATASNSSLVRLWNVPGFSLKAPVPSQGHDGTVSLVTLSADGKTLASGSTDGTVNLWRLEGGMFKKLSTLLKQTPPVHSEALPIYSGALTPDGTTLISRTENEWRIWGLAEAKPLEGARLKNLGFGPVVLSSNGQVLASGEGPRVRLYDLTGAFPKEIMSLEGHKVRSNVLAFSSNNEMLASGGFDKRVILWSLEGNKLLKRREIPASTPVERIAFSPDGKTLALADERGFLVKLWDVTADPPVLLSQFRPHTGLCRGLAFAGDGMSVFVRSVNGNYDSLQQWFTPTDMRCWPLPKSDVDGGARGNDLVVVPDGRHVVLGHRSGAVYILRIEPRSTSHPPLDDDWLKKIAKLPVEKQPDAVLDECKKRNSNMKGPFNFSTPIKGSPLVDLDASGSGFFDATPLQVLQLRRLILREQPIIDLSFLQNMNKLEVLDLKMTAVSDLRPLAGRQLKELVLNGTPVTDLSPLRSMNLELLDLNNTPWLKDLSPIQGMKLKILRLSGTNLSNLGLLRGQPLETLQLYRIPVGTDLSPLKDLPRLKHILLEEYKPERDEKVLRTIKTLETINGKPAAQFWKEREQQAKRP